MNDAALLILCGGFDIGLIMWAVRAHRRRKYRKGDLHYSRKVNAIHDLEAVANELEALQHSIIQVQLASAHKIKGVTISIPDTLPKNTESRVLIDGRSDSTKFLLETLNAEKIRLREELDSKLERLYRYGTTGSTAGEELEQEALFPASAGGRYSRNAVIDTEDKTA